MCRHRYCLALLSLVIPAGCGSAGPLYPGGSGTVTGMIGGRSLDVQDAVFVPDEVVYDGSSMWHQTTLFLTPFASACSSITANQTVKSSWYLAFSLGVITSSTASAIPGPGTYPASDGYLGPGNYSTVTLASTTSTCLFVPKIAATAGEVTITSLAAAELDGSFDLTMSTGDHVTGTFHAASCPGIAGWANPAPATCI